MATLASRDPMFAWLKRLWDRIRHPFYAKHIDPVVIPCVDRAQAETAANTFAANNPDLIVREYDGRTGSMTPLIPAAPGFYVAKKIQFKDVRLGTVGTYRPEFQVGEFMHRMVAKDKLGYLASGDANPRTESWARVTENNYTGEVLRLWHYRV